MWMDVVPWTPPAAAADAVARRREWTTSSSRTSLARVEPSRVRVRTTHHRHQPPRPGENAERSYAARANAAIALCTSRAHRAHTRTRALVRRAGALVRTTTTTILAAIGFFARSLSLSLSSDRLAFPYAGRLYSPDRRRVPRDVWWCPMNEHGSVYNTRARRRRLRVSVGVSDHRRRRRRRRRQ